MILFYIITLIYGSQSLSLQSLDRVLSEKAPGSTNIEKPSNLLTKIKSNPKEFVAEVQNLDPEALQTVITLVEELLQSSKDEKQKLIDDLADRSDSLNEANTNVVNAEEALKNSNQAVVEAQTVADTASTYLKSVKEIQVEKTREKDNSQSNHDTETPRLITEQETMTEVLNLLNVLPTSEVRTGFCANLANNLLGTCTQNGDSFTLSAQGGLGYQSAGMDNDGGGFYAENICLLALYGEEASSYTSKGIFSKANFIIGGGSWGHIHGISNQRLSDVLSFKAMGLHVGPVCCTSWTSLTCTFVAPE